MSIDKKILLVGGGRMGSALVSGWIESGIEAANIAVIDPDDKQLEALQEKLSVQGAAAPNKLKDSFKPDIIVLAVKPQAMDKVAPLYKVFSDESSVFLSIAAGKNLKYLESKLGGDAAIIRAMPNLPATVRQGITVMVSNDSVSSDQRDVCSLLMEAVGQTVWIDDESLMDAVTAVSGSGPAYVFYFLEAMVAAAVDIGVDKEVAEKLVRATISGSIQLADGSDSDVAELRRQVTSPGGTTEAAMEILAKDDVFKNLMRQAITAAEDRSKHLSS